VEARAQPRPVDVKVIADKTSRLDRTRFQGRSFEGDGHRRQGHAQPRTGVNPEMKPEQDRLVAGGFLRRGDARLRPPEIVGQVDNAALEAIRRL
jgi:hypothetical protein